MISFDRGTVWWIDLPLNLQSHVQGGARPCVIVSNHLERSGVVTVCPLSTKIDSIKTHPKVHVKKDGQVLIEQITTVDISSISNYVGILEEDDMTAIDEALHSYLLGEVNVDDTSNVTGISKLGLKLLSIEKDLKKIVKMLEFLLWKDSSTTYEKDLRNF